MTTPDHFCPGCGKPQKAFLRYPWYFCRDCCETACDSDGRILSFGNISLSGGLTFSFDDEDVYYECGNVLCYIKNRPAIVSEARFGGVVAQPMLSGPVGRTPYFLVDVRKGVSSEKPLTPKPKKAP